MVQCDNTDSLMITSDQKQSFPILSIHFCFFFFLFYLWKNLVCLWKLTNRKKRAIAWLVHGCRRILFLSLFLSFFLSFFPSFLPSFLPSFFLSLINVFVFNFIIGYFTYLHFKCYPPSKFPLCKPPIPSPIFPASMRVLPYPPIHSCLTTLAFSSAGTSSFHRIKGFSSH